MCVAHAPQSKKRMRAVEAKLGVWMSEMKKRRKDRERELQLHTDGEKTTTFHWRNDREGKSVK